MADELNLTGSQRAAIFLLGVGEQAATEVMRHMSAKEVQQVGEAMATISKLTNNQVESVLADFHLESAEINPLGLEAPDFTRRVMTSALGQDKAQNILSQVLETPRSTMVLRHSSGWHQRLSPMCLEGNIRRSPQRL